MLGTVKFLFPNKHDVYMHDTTQKNSVRAVGARREPRLHAGAESATARAGPAASRPRLVAGEYRSGAATGDDNHVQLKTHIPVYITYFTLKVNDDGSISTFNDIYGHDARMAAALYGKPDLLQGAGRNRQRRGCRVSRGARAAAGRSPRQREAFDNDFTRALFGF